MVPVFFRNKNSIGSAVRGSIKLNFSRKQEALVSCFYKAHVIFVAK